jgi:hypothetical protein
MDLAKTIFVGIKGSVVALDRHSGRMLWQAKLKGSDFVNLVCDRTAIYATTHGEIFCVDPQSGQIRWHNPLKRLGTGLASMLLPEMGQSEPPVVLAAKRRRDEQAAAAAGAAAAGAAGAG